MLANIVAASHNTRFLQTHNVNDNQHQNTTTAPAAATSLNLCG